MSQSENSSDNTGTQAPVSYVDMQSLHEEDDTDEEGEVESPTTTVICKDDIELMMKCTMAILDNSNEILNFMAELNRMCDMFQTRMKR